MVGGKKFEPSSARSVVKKSSSSTTKPSGPLSLSKESTFKRPKDVNAGRSNDVQRSIKLTKYLQTRLKVCKLEEEMKKRQDFYSNKITEIWTANDELSEKIHGKQASLTRLNVLKETFDRLTRENDFVTELSSKLTSLDNDLEFLFTHIEGQTSHIALQGIDKTSLNKLNDICESVGSLDGPAISEIAKLAEEVCKLRCFIGESSKIQEDLDRLKAELKLAGQEFASLEDVENSI